MERAEGNCNWVGSHLNEIKKVYAPVHPEIGQQIEALLQLTELLQEGIVNLRSTI